VAVISQNNTEYQQPLDIGNRACVHLGAKLMSAADFYTSPVTQQGQSMAFVYDKVRRAELTSNVWRFSIRQATMRAISDGVLKMVPNAWVSTQNYERGAIASVNNIPYVSIQPGNVGIQPGTVGSTAWDMFFGCPAVYPFDNATGYWLGESVYKSNYSGKTMAFTTTQDTAQGIVNQASGPVSSSSSPNSNDPSIPTPWLITTIYEQGDVVQDPVSGFYYRSFINVNLGNYPNTYVMFNASTTYRQNDIVTGQDGQLYQSYVFNNKGNDPTLDATHAFWSPTSQVNPWIPAFSGSSCAQGWIRQNTGLTNAVPVYPIGSGPTTQTWNRNVFLLPFGFLRRAPQDPKAGVFSYLGAPSGLMADDFNLENEFLTSRTPWPISLRFAADITLVPKMDALFQEALAARLAFDCAEFVTQSAEKKKMIGDIYASYIGRARTVNGIETGPTEPPLDDYLTCRL
jgi:hypothetical protein